MKRGMVEAGLILMAVFGLVCVLSGCSAQQAAVYSQSRVDGDVTEQGRLKSSPGRDDASARYVPRG